MFLLRTKDQFEVLPHCTSQESKPIVVCSDAISRHFFNTWFFGPQHGKQVAYLSSSTGACARCAIMHKMLQNDEVAKPMTWIKGYLLFFF